MKKITFILAFCTFSLLAKAVVTDVTLPVDYNSFFATSATAANGTDLEKSTTATVQEWYKRSFSTGSVSPTIQANSLGFANYVDNYLSKEIVLARTYSAVRCSAFRLYTTADATLGTYYASVLINVSQTTSTEKEILSFDKLSGGTSTRARVFIKSGTSGFQLGIASNGLATIVYANPEYSYNTTYLLVIKYVIGSTTEDASLFVNPTVGETEPTATATATQSATSGGQVICFNIYKQDAVASKIAGIRIGKSWADVVKSGGKLPAPSLLPVENITATGFTAKWTTVAAATGYEVYVYQGGVQVGSANQVSGQATSSLAITGLSGNSAYTFKVVAKGNGSSSLDSDLSVASAEVTTQNIFNVNGIKSISELTNLSSESTITVSNGGTLNIDVAKTINSLTLNSGGQATLNNGISFTVSLLNINSDNINGTATFVDNGGTLTATTTNVQQYLGTARNWYVSSPLTNAKTPATGYTCYKFDETGLNPSPVAPATAYWVNVPASSTMIPGTGYIALPGTTGASIIFSTETGGTLNTGNVDIALTKSGSGFNLIGNPYPSHLTWTADFVNNLTNAALIEPTIWIRTNAKTANSGVDAQWSYTTYNASVSESVPFVNVLIAPMQAFWIKAKTAGILTLDDKLTRSHQALNSNPLKTQAVKNADRQRLRLQVDNGTTTDETLIYFDSNALDSYDRYDSPKFTENNVNATQLYTTVGTDKLVINGMKSISKDTEIPLGFTTGQAGTFTIKASQISNFDPSINIYLQDNEDLINTPVLLTANATYTFNSNITTNNTNRFVLIFKVSSLTAGIDQVSSGNVRISTNANNQLIINGRGTLSIYNAVGQKLTTKNLTADNTVLETSLQSGVYIVAVTNAGKRITQKVIIN